MTEIANHPLMLILKDTISGDGFLAGITLSGRALMVEEDDGKWWMYGVRPAAIAESGDTVQEAFLHFRNRYTEVLFDMAQEYRTFDSFKKEVKRFFYEADEEEERRWDDALLAVRGSDQPPPEPFSQLPRAHPENQPTHITVEQLDTEGRVFRPTDNVRDTLATFRRKSEGATVVV
jgi:hypothetical protein